jgi:hypothetical protein
MSSCVVSRVHPSLLPLRGYAIHRYTPVRGVRERGVHERSCNQYQKDPAVAESSANGVAKIGKRAG